MISLGVFDDQELPVAPELSGKNNAPSIRGHHLGAGRGLQRDSLAGQAGSHRLTIPADDPPHRRRRQFAPLTADRCSFYPSGKPGRCLGAPRRPGFLLAPGLVQPVQKLAQARYLAGQNLQPPDLGTSLRQSAVLERRFLSEKRAQAFPFALQPGGHVSQLGLFLRHVAPRLGQALEIVPKPYRPFFDLGHRGAKQDGAAHRIGGGPGLRNQGFRRIPRHPLQGHEDAGKLPAPGR